MIYDERKNSSEKGFWHDNPLTFFCSVDLLEMSPFSFWTSKNTFNSPLFLKDIFAGHRLLGWQVFFRFNTLKMLLTIFSLALFPIRNWLSFSPLFLVRNVAFLIWMLYHWFWIMDYDVPWYSFLHVVCVAGQGKGTGDGVNVDLCLSCCCEFIVFIKFGKSMVKILF